MATEKQREVDRREMERLRTETNKAEREMWRSVALSLMRATSQCERLIVIMTEKNSEVPF